VLYHHSTRGNHWAHWFFLSDEKHHKYISKHLLTGFSTSLGMRRGTEMQLGFLDFQQFLPKLVGESSILVRDNRMRHAMEFEYIIHKKLNHSGCVEWVLKRKKWTYLERWSTTTMMTDLFLDFGNPTMKSIEISIQIVGGNEIW